MGLYTVSIIPNTRVFDSLKNSFLYGVSPQNIADIRTLYQLFSYGIFDPKRATENSMFIHFWGFIKTLTQGLGTANPDSPA